jgi:serine O-acetyltransferase
MRQYRSHRERLVAVLIWISRTIPGSGVLLMVICGADIPTEVQLGRGVRFPHGARAVVIHPTCVIGDNVVINHSVTLGARAGSPGAPVVEDDVRIGAGAVVIGRVTLGRGCKIGPNAYVRHDVPAYATAIGNPATIRHPRDRSDTGPNGVPSRP